MSLNLLFNPFFSVIAVSLISTWDSSNRSFLTQKTLANFDFAIAQSCTTTEVEQYTAAFRDPWQQETAVRQLVATCGQTAIPSLTGALQTEPDARVRQMATIALGHIGGSEVTQALMDTLKTDSDPTVRKTAADALGYIRAASAVNPLIITLENPKEVIKVRQAAAEALGLIGGKTAIDRLLATLKNTRVPLDVRQAAAKALGQIRDPAIDELVRALQDSDLRTRYWAVKTLTEINSPRSLNALKTNQAKVTQILEVAYKAEIVEFDRVPATQAAAGSTRQLARKPIVCQNKWIAQHWARCR